MKALESPAFRAIRPTAARRRRVSELAIVVAGIVVCQAILYGPSLIGVKILLPLDLLAGEGIYLPRTSEFAGLVPHDVALSDLVYFNEPERRFVNSEIRAGRIPLWTPYRFGGSPIYPLAVSPVWIPAYLIASPVVLAWTQVLVALFAGLGTYLFCKVVLKISFWPAAIVAWCYPLSGSFIIWQGQWLPPVMAGLPWMLTAVHSVIRRPFGWGGPSVCALTTMLLISGAQDIAGQVLLTSGVFGVWSYFDHHGFGRWARHSLAAPAVLAIAWLLGIAGSAWLLLPMNQYIRTGSRMIARSEGTEERPPIGLSALPQVVLPDIYGSTRHGSFRLVTDIFPESSAGAYAGLIATLLVAPLAWCDRRRRSVTAFLTALAGAGLSWSLNFPGMVQLLRLPGLNMMSHNRLVFVTSLAILALAGFALDALLRGGKIEWRWWFLLPVSLLLMLAGWCMYRSVILPEPIASLLPAAVKAGKVIRRIRGFADVVEIQRTFREAYAISAGICLLALGGWTWLWTRGHFPKPVITVLGVLLLSDLLWFGYGRAGQCDPALYYPRIPLLERISREPPGRIIGFGALPANLSQPCGLPDIRGYDGVDPARMVELLRSVAHPDSPNYPSGRTEYMSPASLMATVPGGCQLPPVLDMLNVRYVIIRGQPQAGVIAALTGDDYWALVNFNALPRAFAPQRVEVIADGHERIRRLSAKEFDGRSVAFVETPLDLPKECSGTATIVEEVPRQIRIALDMQTAGLVVLSDNWDIGWRAYLNGQPVPILHVNHAVRGVVAPIGKGTLEFCFEPPALYLGAMISSLAILGFLIWLGLVGWSTRKMPKREMRGV